MFAIYHQPAPFSTPFQSTRPILTQLAPRDSNARFFPPQTSPLFSKMSTSASTSSSNSRSATPSISTSARPSPHPRVTHVQGSKFSTLKQDPDARKEKRRREYLERVREGREEKKGEARAEMGMRREWIEERRKWWDDMEKEGEAEGFVRMEMEEEEVEMGDVDADLRELEMLEMEEQMLDAMAREAEGQEHEMTDYGSEDEDYELLMMDIAMQAESDADVAFASSAREGDQGMDLS